MRLGKRKAEAEARSQIIAAREADIKGDEERQARTLQLAMKNIEIASEAKSAKERVRASERNSVRNYMATVAKTETERNRRMAAFDAHQKDNPSASKFESMQAVENLLAPRSGLGLDRALSRDAKINSQVEKFYKSIRDNNAGSFGGWRGDEKSGH